MRAECSTFPDYARHVNCLPQNDQRRQASSILVGRLTGYNNETALCVESRSLSTTTTSRNSPKRQGDLNRPRTQRDGRGTNTNKHDDRQPQAVVNKKATEKPHPTSAQPPMTLAEAMEESLSLRRRLVHLESLPPVWSTSSIEVPNEEERIAIFNDTRTLWDKVASAVNMGHLKPSGKHGAGLSRLAKEILILYSQTTPSSDSHAAFQIVKELREWNLQVQPLHYAYLVETAARAQNWNAAAQLFGERIDPDGQSPVKISKHLAVGLYATARNAQIQGGDVVADQVMDAVLQMSMVCPTNQDECKETVLFDLNAACIIYFWAPTQ